MAFKLNELIFLYLSISVSKEFDLSIGDLSPATPFYESKSSFYPLIPNPDYGVVLPVAIVV